MKGEFYNGHGDEHGIRPCHCRRGFKSGVPQCSCIWKKRGVHFASEAISWLVLRRVCVAALGITINFGLEAVSAATVVLAATCGEWLSIETRTELQPRRC
jgi:hypothetical protein